MYVFITPNKAYYCEDKIPSSYNVLRQDRENNYEILMKWLRNSNLKYFDSRAFIDNADATQLDAPIFYFT